jgi:F0F1-type ATP synthase assembly protein I
VSEDELELPPSPKLPDPPRATYSRPRRAPDPTERFLEKRGLGGETSAGMGHAMGIGTGLVGSILAGTGLGWLMDRYLIHPIATPWGLIGGFCLGCLSGFVNLIYRAEALNKK